MNYLIFPSIKFDDMPGNTKILTYGRLAEEFKSLSSQYAAANDIEIDHCETIDQNKLNEYNAIASFSPPKDLDISHIKWIHSFGAGVDAFINRNDLNENLILTRTVGSLGDKIAEYCLTHILAAKQNLYEVYEAQKSKEWKQHNPVQMSNKKIVVLGTGNMGRAVAKLFSKLGVNVLGINRDGRQIEGFEKCYSFDQLQSIGRHDPVVTEIDTLICTLPAAPGTKELLTPEFFSKFSGLHFINVGRGSVVSEETILSAIQKENISRATLDVFSCEPLPSFSKLWNNKKVFITPHQASLTDVKDVTESFQSVFKALKEGIRNSLFVDLEIGY